MKVLEKGIYAFYNYICAKNRRFIHSINYTNAKKKLLICNQILESLYGIIYIGTIRAHLD